MPLKPLNTFTVAVMLGFTLLLLFFSGFLEFPSVSSSIQPINRPGSSETKSGPDPFTNLIGAFRKWDSQVGCARFKEKHKALVPVQSNGSSSLQDFGLECPELKMEHVSVLVKGWTWIPDNLDNLYSCRCGLSCLWTKSSVLADRPDALLFETTTPPPQVLFCSPVWPK
jgi:alpha-1,4-fucosyltransferase